MLCSNIGSKSLLSTRCMALASLLMADCMGSVHPRRRPYLSGLSFAIVLQTPYILPSHNIRLAYAYVLLSFLLFADGKSETFHNLTPWTTCYDFCRQAECFTCLPAGFAAG